MRVYLEVSDADLEYAIVKALHTASNTQGSKSNDKSYTCTVQLCSSECHCTDVWIYGNGKSAPDGMAHAHPNGHQVFDILAVQPRRTCTYTHPSLRLYRSLELLDSLCDLFTEFAPILVAAIYPTPLTFKVAKSTMHHLPTSISRWRPLH